MKYVAKRKSGYHAAQGDQLFMEADQWDMISNKQKSFAKSLKGSTNYEPSKKVDLVSTDKQMFIFTWIHL